MSSESDEADSITLEEGQVWEWDTDEGEVLLHDSTVTIERLFERDDGTPMVTFTEPSDGLYAKRENTVTKLSLEMTLADEYVLHSP